MAQVIQISLVCSAIMVQSTWESNKIQKF